jgi:hypothetical protein
MFFDEICCLTTKKKNCHQKLGKSCQGRQTSAKSRNLLFKFKDFYLFCAGALSQLIFLNVFLTQYAVWQLKTELPSKKVIFKFEDKMPAFSSRLSVLITVFQVFDGNSFF